MSRRLFEGPHSEWTDEARKIAHEVDRVVGDILLEAEEKGPVDIRDFYFVVSASLTDIILMESIDRRCNRPKTKEKP